MPQSPHLLHFLCLIFVAILTFLCQWWSRTFTDIKWIKCTIPWILCWSMISRTFVNNAMRKQQENISNRKISGGQCSTELYLKQKSSASLHHHLRLLDFLSLIDFEKQETNRLFRERPGRKYMEIIANRENILYPWFLCHDRQLCFIHSNDFSRIGWKQISYCY